jgi:cephalosporin hydroxylase
MDKNELIYLINKYKPIQNYWELYWLLDQVERLNPNVILEIGVNTGGTLGLWNYVLRNKRNPILIGVDIENKLKWDTRKSKNKIKFLIADSIKQDTVVKVKNILQDKKVDFLYIDGNHSEKYVASDYQNYSKFVRRGGIVAFHDINNVRHPGVGQFWSKVIGRKEICICNHGTGIITV